MTLQRPLPPLRRVMLAFSAATPTAAFRRSTKPMPCVNYQHFTTRSSVSAQKKPLDAVLQERSTAYEIIFLPFHSNATRSNTLLSFLHKSRTGGTSTDSAFAMPTGTGRGKKSSSSLLSLSRNPKPHLLCTFFSYAHVVSQANLSRSLPSRPTAHLSETRLQCKGEPRRADFAVGRFGYFLAHWREAERKRMRAKVSRIHQDVSKG